MVALRFKYRIEINAGHAEAFEVAELLLDSLQVAAKIVIVEHLTIGGRNPVRVSVSVGSQNSVRRDILLFCARKSETVGKNLINYAALEPFGSAEIFIVNRELPVVALSLDRSDSVAGVVDSACAPRGIVFKMIHVKCGVLGGKINFPPFLAAALHAVPLHADKAVFRSPGLFNYQLCGVTAKITGQNYAKCNRLTGFYCPENAFVIF